MLKKESVVPSNDDVSGLRRNERGVALIIVLLVTALLIALIFEFAYGTRISLRATINFRDSERAYYLARSGVNLVSLLLSDNLKKGKPQDQLEGEKNVSNELGFSDAQLDVRWEDEGGKIDVTTLTKGSTGYSRLSALFEIQGINRDRLDQIAEWQQSEFRRFYLITELHQFLSDEEFGKIQNFVTTAPVTQIDVNTSSAPVLQSIGISSGMAAMIVERRKAQPFTDPAEINNFLGPTGAMIAGQLSTTSNYFKVYSFATVGGYTKQIEAIIQRRGDGTGANALYWRAL
jgi:type II secretory pathway component PulK